MIKESSKGFTLIELLVVIAIIAILAILIIIRIGGTQRDAKNAKAKSDLEEMKKAVNIAKSISGKTLIDITGSGCSSCTSIPAHPLPNQCRNATDINNVPDDHICITVLRDNFDKIQAVGGVGAGGNFLDP